MPPSRRLKAAGSQLPNQAVLINTLPLMEAQASSEIENIVTTADALFRQAQLDERTADPATKEALRYRTALRRGVELLERRPLGTALAEEVCSTLMGREMGIRKIPGTVLKNQATGKIIYTPPIGEALLREQLANWEKFAPRAGIDRSADSDGRRPLPVRGDPSLHWTATAAPGAS